MRPPHFVSRYPPGVRLIAVGLVVVAFASAAGTAAAKPTLTLSSGERTLIHGAHFTPHSVVRLLVSGSKNSSAKVRTNDNGAFTYFLAPSLDRCEGLFVQAFGVHGERADFSIGVPNCGDAGVGDVSK